MGQGCCGGVQDGASRMWCGALLCFFFFLADGARATATGSQSISYDDLPETHTCLLKHMTAVDYSSSAMNDEDALVLAKGLKYNTVISSVTLANNFITGEGMKWLAKALKGKPVKVFYIGGCPLGDAGHERLLEVLETWGDLTSLRVHNTGLGAERLLSLIQCLKDKPVLESFGYGSPPMYSGPGGKGYVVSFSSEERTRIMESMTEEPHPLLSRLRALLFWGWVIDDLNAPVMARGLKDNMELAHVDLRHNHIGPSGMKVLAEVLTGKPLQVFYICDNPLGDEGHEHLAKAVESWKGLTHFGIISTGLSQGVALPKALMGKNLLELSFQNNPLSPEVKKAFLRVLANTD